MKILFTSSEGKAPTPPAATAPAGPSVAELQNLKNGLQLVQEQLKTWHDESLQGVEASTKRLRDELRPLAAASTENVLQAVQALSQRVQALEKIQAPSAAQMSAELQDFVKRELKNLDEKLAKAGQATEAKLSAQDAALEKMRGALVKPEPATPPISAPAPEPLPPAPEPVKIETPMENFEALKDQLTESPMADEAPRPSWLSRFWRYLNAPAIEIPAGRPKERDGE